MAWIPSHQELGQHPKTKRLSRMLGINVRETVGLLHFLWWWALDYAPDGDISDYDAEDIADAVMWEGDADELITALLECGPGGSCGFLERVGESLLIHDWDEHGGKRHRERKQAAERKRRSRLTKSGATDGSQTGHGDVTRDATVTDGAVTVGEERRREEKRREPPLTPPYGEIVSYLNEQTGKNFRSSARDTQRRINARWREGYRLDDFKAVIDVKTAEWKGTSQDQYLRPETLFGTKFESYLNQRRQHGNGHDARASPPPKLDPEVQRKFDEWLEQERQGDREASVNVCDLFGTGT